MKKLIAFVLVLFLSVVAIGCGGGEETPGGEDNPGTTETVKPTDITLGGTLEEITVGEEFTITTEVTPSNATNKNVRVTANPAGIVEVNGKTINGVAEGEVTITVTAVGDTTVKKEFKLVVKPAPVVEVDPESFTISGKNEVEIGKSVALSITATPDGAVKTATWTSSDESIATVNNGVVKGVKEGKVTITATSTKVPTVSATIEITVIPEKEVEVVKPTSIVISLAEEVYKGYTIRATANVLPEGANPEVRWESRNPDVATIDEKGIITGVSEGTTYITAYSAVDESIKSNRVKVKVEIDQSELIPVNDMQGYVITIMNADSALGDIDPFLDAYTGSDKMYKQQAWKETEAKFNCKFEVVAYPADAPWGPSRVSWINSQAELGKAQADYYIVTTIWLPEFYASGAMHATSTYYAKYSKNQMEPAIKQASTYKGELYAVSTGISSTSLYPVNGIFYNYGLIEQYKLESPAKLFNEGKWSYDEFLDWVLAAQAVLPENMWVISGAPQIYWAGMTEASGVKIANTTTMELNLTHQYSQDAVDILKSAVLGGAWDTAGIDYDEKVISFQTGKAIMQCGQYWFVKASNRFPANLWGDDTRYGYVPYPYHANVGKANSFVNMVDSSIHMQAGAREFNHPAGVTYEDVFRATQEMYLKTIQYQESDPAFDAEAIKRQNASNKLDDPESVDALLFYTADKTLWDPIFDGVSYNYSGNPASKVMSVVVNNTDFNQAMSEIEADIYNKFVLIYG